ncbi:aspartyl protease family protein [Sphingomonas alpina]|uniref:aspartyl protease family protein n=1 Tax=Sphingomonas alpina TaxID=653931 RepID=UPI0021BB533F|nr:aspartyl protease family protein [Sphingomonas alpina]
MFLALAAATPCTSESDPGRLLDANRTAVAASGTPGGTLTSRYAYRSSGLEGETTTTIDLSTGRFANDQRTGIVNGSDGFDGREAWLRDLSGFVKPQAGGDRHELAVNDAYRNANLWWRSDRGGATIQSIGCGAIRVVPKGGKPFEAWFDPTTHLLLKIREMRSFANMVEISYSDYRRRAALLLPTRIDTIHGDDPASRETLTLQDASISPARPAAAFAMPQGNPADWQLPAAGRVTLPFRLLNNHIIVDVKIDGQGPFPFIVDTGGHNILTPSTVAALNLQNQGKGSSSGAGEKTVSSGYTSVREIAAGGAILRDKTIITLEFAPADVEGLQLGGMLGSEFLERFVVMIDYGAAAMTLIDPDRVTPAERQSFGTAVPMRFYIDMPQIDGAIDGRATRLDIDTGARDEVTVTSPFVAAHDLRSRYPGGVTMTTGWGVGGPSRTYTVRARAVALGPVVVPRPIIGLSAAKRGSFSDAAYGGNVGSGLLKRFVTTFDYARRTLYLKPLARIDPDTGRFDRAGMWLNARPDGLEIMDLLPGGPADQAGLRAGDRVTMIGDVSYRDRTLSEMRRSLKLAPITTPVTIRYLRAGAEGVTTVQPRDLIPD